MLHHGEAVTFVAVVFHFGVDRYCGPCRGGGVGRLCSQSSHRRRSDEQICRPLRLSLTGEKGPLITVTVNEQSLDKLLT